MIDLHFHSTYSDGSLTPTRLAEVGSELGLTAMALTDHDCTGGVAEFMDACRRQEPCVRGISGVEISAEVPSGTLHMLGYLIDPDEPRLQRTLARIRGGREERNHLILEKLNELGLDLTWEEVAARAGEDVVGRPHFASALTARGYVADKQEAFDRYLAKGQPAYCDRLRLSPEDSVRAIRGAGGVAVVAHPFTLGLDAGALRRYVAELAEKGLQGIEVYYSEHTPEMEAEYAALAREFGLVAVGGSDFHGEVNPKVKLGRGFGSLDVPDEAAEALCALAPAGGGGL